MDRLIPKALLIVGVILLFHCPGAKILADENVPAESPATISLNLDQILHRVLNANRRLTATTFLVQDAQYSLESAKSDFDWKIQPVANLGLSKSENTTEKASGISGEISKKSNSGIRISLTPSVAYVNNSGTSSGVGISLSIPLFRGFGREYTYDAINSADFSLQTRIRQASLAKVQTVLKTVNLVYEILRRQELIHLYTFQENRLQGHAATAQIKETTGLGTPIDTYRAQIRLKDVQEQLTVAHERHQEMLDRLKIMLALPMKSKLKIRAPITYTPTRISLREAVEIAMKNRIEIKQTAAELSEALRKSKVAKLRMLPDVNLVATYRKNTFLQGLASSELYYGDSWSIGLTSSTDLARSKEKTAFQQSILKVRRIQLQQQDIKDTVQTEVKQQLNALAKEEERIQLRKEQIIHAKGKMRLAEIKFSHGMGDNFDLIESETELQRAKSNLLRKKTSYIIGQYKLRAALGTLIAQ